MVFSDVASAIAYVEMILNSGMQEMSEEIKLIMDNVTQEQVEGWTYQIFDSIVAEGFGHEASAEFKDNARWESWNTGKQVGNPIKFLEGGHTKGRGASNIMDTSFNRCQDEMPDKLKQYLASRGIPIE